MLDNGGTADVSPLAFLAWFCLRISPANLHREKNARQRAYQAALTGGVW
jgi:hypothetical protein